MTDIKETAEERAARELKEVARTEEALCATQKAHEEYEGLKMDSATFYAENAHIIDEYNVRQSRVDDAKNAFKRVYAKTFRYVGKKFARFSVVQKTDIDIDLLANLLEATGNPLLDDLIQTTKVLDRKAYYAAVKRGDISDEIADEVESEGSTSVRSS